jgi:hypothetical protein
MTILWNFAAEGKRASCRIALQPRTAKASDSPEEWERTKEKISSKTHQLWSMYERRYWNAMEIANANIWTKVLILLYYGYKSSSMSIGFRSEDVFAAKRIRLVCLPTPSNACSSSIRHHVTICAALGSPNICLLLLSFSVHAIGTVANKHVPAWTAGIIKVVVYGWVITSDPIFDSRVWARWKSWSWLILFKAPWLVQKIIRIIFLLTIPSCSFVS